MATLTERLEQLEAHTRALFRPAASADAFVERIFSTRQLKDLRRRERRLAESGAVEYGVDCTEMEGERFAAPQHVIHDGRDVVVVRARAEE